MTTTTFLSRYINLCRGKCLTLRMVEKHKNVPARETSLPAAHPDESPNATSHPEAMRKAGTPLRVSIVARLFLDCCSIVARLLCLFSPRSVSAARMCSRHRNSPDAMRLDVFGAALVTRLPTAGGRHIFRVTHLISVRCPRVGGKSYLQPSLNLSLIHI